MNVYVRVLGGGVGPEWMNHWLMESVEDPWSNGIKNKIIKTEFSRRPFSREWLKNLPTQIASSHWKKEKKRKTEE